MCYLSKETKMAEVESGKAEAERVYYLENDAGRFWEIKTRDLQSVIRFGKAGCKGRTCAAKLHKTAARCRQWARTQTNAKRMEGYLEPAERSPGPTLKRRITAIQAERLGLTKQETIALTPPQPPPAATTTTTMTPKPGTTTHTTMKQWRKPHKKQSTIRRLAKQSSVAARRARSVTKATPVNNQSEVRLTPQRTLSVRKARNLLTGL